jgi:hypothetical protein
MASPDLQRPATFQHSYTALSDTTRTSCVSGACALLTRGVEAGLLS